MQEKLLNMQIEEDKLKRGVQGSQERASLAELLSSWHSGGCLRWYHTPPGSANGDATMEDLYGPLPSVDDGVGGQFR